MGCGSSSDRSDSSPPPQQAPPPSRGYVPTKIDMSDILGKPQTGSEDVPAGFSALPDGFPEAPPKPGTFDKPGDEDAYKEYMRKKLRYETWENSLLLYRMRQKDGNFEACDQIVQRLRTELA